MLDLTPFSFLVVDDSPVNQAILQHHLTKLGGHVLLASNGLEALEQCEHLHFDLVFLDIQMPELDGFATVSRLRELYPDLKIVAWTCSVDTSAVCFFDAGFDGQLDKPIFRQSFLDVLTKQLAIKAGSELVEHTNIELVVSELAIHSKEILAVHSGFIASLPERIAELEDLIASQKWDELAFQSRKLRGTAKLNGLTHLAEGLLSVELASVYSDPSVASEPLAALKCAVQQHEQTTQPADRHADG